VVEQEHELQVEQQRQKAPPKKSGRSVRENDRGEEAQGRAGRKPADRPITSKGRKQIVKPIETEVKRLRKLYPEVRGKVVDFIAHAVSDGIL
jgi:hypothetical protein